MTGLLYDIIASSLCKKGYILFQLSLRFFFSFIISLFSSFLFSSFLFSYLQKSIARVAVSICQFLSGGGINHITALHFDETNGGYTFDTGRRKEIKSKE